MVSTRRDRLKRFGLTPDDYASLAQMNDGTCWICNEPEKIAGRGLAVDHCHTTGAVRGLLCTRCNQVIGRMRDDPELLRRAAQYLDDATARFSDYCRECVTGFKERGITAPGVVLSSDGERTVFGYECPRGHIWTCGWRTFGWIWL